jgi:hypothetical protein
MRKGSTTNKPSRETTRKRNAAKRKCWATRRKARILAKGGSEAARIRLHDDGAGGTEAVRRRILWLAHERKLPPADIAKAMTCKLHHLADFIKRHEISYDWLLFGDLKGLQRVPTKPSPAVLTATEVVKLYAELSIEDRREITRKLAELLAKEAADQS